MKTLWIVAANTEEYGRLYLPDYAGQFQHDVARKVMDGAMREGFAGTMDERLSVLGWEIVCLSVEEVTPNAA